MALLFIDSFDHYQTAQLASKWTNTTQGLGSGIVPGAGRCGSQALVMGGSGLGIVEKGIAFPGVTGIVGFAYKETIQLFNSMPIVFLGSALGAGAHVYLTRNLDGSLSATRNDAGPVVLGTTAPDLIRENVYYFIEYKLTVDAAAGVVVVRINGNVVLNLTAQNTKSNLVVGSTLTSMGFYSGASYSAYFDDLYVSDDTGAAPWNDFLGDVRVEYLRPDGPGAHQDWDLVGALTHWQAVDDGAAPDDDVSYIHTSTAGLQDTETYLPTGLPNGTIYGLQVNLYSRKTDSGPRQVAPIIRHAGGDHLGVNQAPSFGSYRFLIQIYPLNPGTGVAWTISDVNAIEVGIAVTV
jgi:hypothetical protein